MQSRAPVLAIAVVSPLRPRHETGVHRPPAAVGANLLCRDVGSMPYSKFSPSFNEQCHCHLPVKSTGGESFDFPFSSEELRGVVQPLTAPFSLADDQRSFASHRRALSRAPQRRQPQPDHLPHFFLYVGLQHQDLLLIDATGLTPPLDPSALPPLAIVSHQAAIIMMS
jgi:hypothetical protein